MDQKPKKLMLHQETLRNLVEDETSNGNRVAGTHTCAPTACAVFSCTLGPC